MKIFSKSVNSLINVPFPSGRKAKLNILIFHRVHDKKRAVFYNSDIDTNNFLWQMKIIKDHFNVLEFNEAIACLISGKLPQRSLVITFDDGYADNYNIAYPILSSLNIPATFFIASGYLNGGIMWNDIIIESINSTSQEYLSLIDTNLGEYSFNSPSQKYEVISTLISKIKYMAPEKRSNIAYSIAEKLNYTPPKNLMMSDNQIHEMSANGMTIGGHTMTHPILTEVSDKTAYKEISDGKLYLENVINKPVKCFAFPNGKPEKDYKYSHVKMVQDIGFDASVSTSYGVSNIKTDIYQLPRFTPWDEKKLKYILRIVSNAYTKPTFSKEI